LRSPKIWYTSVRTDASTRQDNKNADSLRPWQLGLFSLIVNERFVSSYFRAAPQTCWDILRRDAYPSDILMNSVVYHQQ
jgi:hypothetical protein